MNIIVESLIVSPAACRRLLLPMLAAAGLATLPGTAAAPAAQEAEPPYGILVMAHGGTPEWNGRVQRLVAGIRTNIPVELALGMADRATLAEAMHALERSGTRRVVVVRLFVSGDSFREQTEYLLGIDPTAPDMLFDSSRTPGMRPVPDAGAVPPIAHSSDVVVVEEGLVDVPVSGRIIAERALHLSNAPERETILVIAHGMGSADADARLVAALEARADAIREAAPFRDVAVMTLREDWPEARAAAELRIRDRVRRGNDNGTTIVIPFRITGFGPYAEVLDGLDYRADGVGLLPDEAVGDWVVRAARDLACAHGWLPVTCAATQ